MKVVRWILVSLAMVLSLTALSSCDIVFRALGLVAPDAPGGLTVTANADGSLTVAWSESSGASKYQLYRDTSETGSFSTKVYDGSATTYTDADVLAPFAYYYEVKAANETGASDLSDASGTVAVGTLDWQALDFGTSGTWITWGSNETSAVGNLYYYTIQGSALIQDGAGIDTTFIKTSGSVLEGSGVIFGYEDTDNYWEFVVSGDGYYDLWQKSGGTWNDLTGWVASAAVNQGVGVENRLQVDWLSSSGGQIALTINGTSIGTQPAALTAGALTGFAVEVGISGSESFPGTPEIVLFSQADPVSLPSIASMPNTQSAAALAAGTRAATDAERPLRAATPRK